MLLWVHVSRQCMNVWMQTGHVKLNKGSKVTRKALIKSIYLLFTYSVVDKWRGCIFLPHELTNETRTKYICTTCDGNLSMLTAGATSSTNACVAEQTDSLDPKTGCRRWLMTTIASISALHNSNNRHTPAQKMEHSRIWHRHKVNPPCVTLQLSVTLLPPDSLAVAIFFQSQLVPMSETQIVFRNQVGNDLYTWLHHN